MENGKAYTLTLDAQELHDLIEAALVESAERLPETKEETNE